MNTLHTNTSIELKSPDRLAQRRERDRKRREAARNGAESALPAVAAVLKSDAASKKPETNVLTAKAVLADLTIGSWAVSKFDREITAEINERHNTLKAGFFNKKLLNSGLYTAIEHVSEEARATHRRMTKPWLDGGCRILPTTLFVTHANAMRELRLKHEAARDEFLKEYPRLVEERKAELKNLFNAGDYPSVEFLRPRFYFEVRLLPIPVASDFRVELADAQLDKAKADLEANMKGVLDDAMKDTRQQIVVAVGAMAEKLKNFDPDASSRKDRGIFHQSLVDNMRELVELLPAFNLTEDPKLTKVIARMQKELCNEEAKELRENEDVRKVVQKSAEEILADVSNFLA